MQRPLSSGEKSRAPAHRFLGKRATILCGEGGSGSKGNLGTAGKGVGTGQPKALGPRSCHLKSPSCRPLWKAYFS